MAFFAAALFSRYYRAMLKKYRWILLTSLLVSSSTILADNTNEKHEPPNARTQIDLALKSIQDATSVEGQIDWTPYNDALASAQNQQYEIAADLLKSLLQRNSNSNSDEQNRMYTAAWALAKQIGIVEPSQDPLPTVRANLARRVLPENILDEIYSIKDDQDPTIVILSSQDSRCVYCVPADKALIKFARESKRSGNRYNFLYVGSEPYIDALNEPTKSMEAMGVKGLPMYLLIHNGEYVYAWEGYNEKQFTYLLNNIDTVKTGADRRKLVFSKQDTLLDFVQTKYSAYTDSTDNFKAMAFALNQNALEVFYAYDLPNQKSANQSALNKCMSNEIVLKYNIRCELYAEGDNIVSTKALERAKNKAVQIHADSEAQAIAKEKLEQEKATGSAATKNSNNMVAKSSQKKPKQQLTISDADLKNALSNYKNSKEHFKSFASSGTDANSAFAAAVKAPTQTVANSRALLKCQQFAEALGTPRRCTLNYIGDTEVLEYDEASIARQTLKVQRKAIKKSSLKSSYSKYRRLSEDKAYAISHDDSNGLVYAIAFGKRGEDKATEAALAQCEDKRQQKSLERPCRLLIINGEFQE
jgi:hypothetical protein